MKGLWLASRKLTSNRPRDLTHCPDPQRLALLPEPASRQPDIPFWLSAYDGRTQHHPGSARRLEAAGLRAFDTAALQAWR